MMIYYINEEIVYSTPEKEYVLQHEMGHQHQYVLVTSCLLLYHVDWCTKNKCMIQIPMRGLLLTCTESSFLLCTYITVED
jgi:hypothetical protein